MGGPVFTPFPPSLSAFPVVPFCPPRHLTPTLIVMGSNRCEPTTMSR